MPQVKLSPVFNSQVVDENGSPAAGWQIFTYAAGSSTPLAAYTDSTGNTPQSSPIVLDALGFPAMGQIWLQAGRAYKLQLTDAGGVVKKTEDNVTGVNDTSVSTDEWGDTGVSPTYISTTSFSLLGDQTSAFHIGRRAKFQVTAGTVYGRIISSVFTTLTTVTMVMDGSQVLDSGLSVVQLSNLRANVLSLPERIATVSGTDTYTATVGISRMVIGDEYKLKFTNSNLTTSPTLNLDSMGALALVGQSGTALSVGSINGEHLVRYNGTNFTLLNPITILQTPIQIRQCVQYGPWTTPTGINPAQPDLIPQSQVGNTLAAGVTLKCSTAPTLFSVANGFNADGSPLNLNYRATADIPVPNLAASATNYIWFDTVALTSGAVTVADNEQSGGTIPVTNNQYTYDRVTKKMYLGNGTTAAQVNRLIVAEVDTSGSAVTAVRVRPYLLRSEGDWVTPLPGLAVAFSQNHNLGSTEAVDGYLELRCLTAEDAFTVGEIVRGATGTNTNYANPQTVRLRRNTANMIAGGATPWVVSGIGGSIFSLTSARWAYRFVCSRQNR